MKKKSLSVNALLNGLRSVLNLIFPLITFPYISRVLSVSGVGKYNFSSTYVGYFTLIAGLGISTYAVREGAKYRNNYKKISDFASQIFTINIYSTVISYVLLFLSLILFRNLAIYVNCILIFSIQIFFTTMGTEWIYTIYEDYAYITIRSVVFKIISIVLLFILVRKPGDYLWYTLVTVLSSVGSNILNFVHARSLCSIKLVKKIDWNLHLSPIFIIFASTVAVNIYVFSDVTILGLLKDDEAVGIYSVAVKIYQIAQGLLAAILTVTIPRLAMLFGKRMFEEYKQVLSKVLNTLSVLVLPTVVGLIMLSREVTLVIAGSKYLDSVMALRIIALAIIFSIFSWIFSDCVLIPSKREKLVLRTTLITACFNVALNFVLVPIMSYDGTSLTTVLSEFLSMSLNLYWSFDIVKDIMVGKDNQKAMFTSVIGCLFIVIYCSLVQYCVSSMWINIIVSVVGSVLGYFGILFLLKNPVVTSYVTDFMKRRNH